MIIKQEEKIHFLQLIQEVQAQQEQIMETQEQQKIIVVQQIVTMKTIVLQIIKQTEQTQIM